MRRQCPEIAAALRLQESLRGRITGLAGSIASDGEPVLLGMLIRLQDEWDASVGACPLSSSAEDQTQQHHLETSWRQGVELMHEVLTEIGAYQGWDGWVNHEEYPVYKQRLARCRESFLNRYAKNEDERRQWIQAWPFEDKVHP
jgi:hypothetical protein